MRHCPVTLRQSKPRTPNGIVVVNETSAVQEAVQKETDSFLQDVLEGLAMSPKRIPSKYLYDAKGSKLFDAICEQPEYYPTRTEIAIMSESIDEIAQAIGSDATLIEFGSGSGVKTELLLQDCELAEYVPIDISRTHLHESAARLASRFPETRIHPVCGDFSDPGFIPEEKIDGPRRIVFFPGSTIGNFEFHEADALLANISNCCGEQGGLLIGIDLRKDVQVLESAYNDAAQVTDAFTLNLLTRLNRELEVEVDVDAFEHLGFYNQEFDRIEIYLESQKRQSILVEGREFELEANERILTEYAHKYDVEEFAERAARHSLHLRHQWTDDQDWFAVLFFESES